MWLAILLLLGIALCIAGFIWGTLWIAVPALLLIAAGAIFHFTTIRSDVDSVGKLEKGPVQDADTPEDAPGGPTHATTGYAHGGQADMTP